MLVRGDGLSAVGEAQTALGRNYHYFDYPDNGE